jgi:hypothetical protein
LMPSGCLRAAARRRRRCGLAVEPVAAVSSTTV